MTTPAGAFLQKAVCLRANAVSGFDASNLNAGQLSAEHAPHVLRCKGSRRSPTNQIIGEVLEDKHRDRWHDRRSTTLAATRPPSSPRPGNHQPRRPQEI